MRFRIIRSLYPENVPRFTHSSSLKWYSVGRIYLASTFFSCLDTRKEDKRKSRPLQRPRKLAGYMMNLKNGSSDRDEYKIHLKNVPGKTSLPRQGPCLDTRKEGKRKSRPLPRPGKLVGYMMEIENVMRFQIIRSLYPENAIRFPVTR